MEAASRMASSAQILDSGRQPLDFRIKENVESSDIPAGSVLGIPLISVICHTKVWTSQTMITAKACFTHYPHDNQDKRGLFSVAYTAFSAIPRRSWARLAVSEPWGHVALWAPKVATKQQYQWPPSHVPPPLWPQQTRPWILI